MADSVSLPQQTHIGEIVLNVSDLERSLTFYRDVLGYHAASRSGGHAGLSAGGSSGARITLVEKRGAKPRPFRSAGLFHVAIRVPDRRSLSNVLHTLAAQKYPLQGASHHGVSEALYLADPDRNGIEIYVDLPRETWQWSGGQVQMVTEPLDLEDLFMASADADGDQMHPETIIGHVHLQVTDLARSSHFYHELLGFDLTQTDYPGALFLSAGGYHHHIGLNVWQSAGGSPVTADALGLAVFSIVVPDAGTIASLRQRLMSEGIEILPPPDEIPHAAFAVFDPDNIRVAVAEG